MSLDKRDSFVFYRSFYEAIKDLPRDIQGEIYTAIMEYSLYGKETDNLKPVARSIFTLIKPQLDANQKRFENGKKGAEHGKKGGRPRKEKNPEETPKKPLKNPTQTPNVNDNVNVNDNERETRAIDYLKNKLPTRYQMDFQMKYQNHITNIDKFVEDFNDTCDQEGLEFTPKILFARLGKYARNWIENQNKQPGRFQNSQTATYDSGKLDRF